MIEDRNVWVNLKTKMGPISIAWGSKGLTRIALNESYQPIGKPSPRFEKFLDRLSDYLSGKRVEFNVPIDLSDHTPFRQEVLHACSKILYGETATYGDLAMEAGSPNAARAVGQTMAHNTIAIVIPCHRVLASSGIGGYMRDCPDGLEWKRYFLRLEGIRL